MYIIFFMQPVFCSSTFLKAKVVIYQKIASVSQKILFLGFFLSALLYIDFIFGSLFGWLSSD